MLRQGFINSVRRMATVLTPKVEHDLKNKVFFIALSDSTVNKGATQSPVRAILDYEVLPSGALDLYHTEVPVPLRGQGIAAHLVQAAFDYCVKNQLKMKLTCTYVAKYYNENTRPEYTSLVVE